MTEAQISLNNYVQLIANCRNSTFMEAAEVTPPLPMSASLHDLAKGRGLEQLYVPFDIINHTHKYKGKLGFCYKEAMHLALSDPIFIYCEGYASSEQICIPLMHAWCVNRETREVYDPVWNNKKTKGNAYSGIPFNVKFVTEVILHTKLYGVLDSLWMCKHLLATPLSDIVHPDYQAVVLASKQNVEIT
jgi:hypothetical protein